MDRQRKPTSQLNPAQEQANDIPQVQPQLTNQDCNAGAIERHQMTMTGASPASRDADGTSGTPTRHWMVLTSAHEWQTQARRHGFPITTTDLLDTIRDHLAGVPSTSYTVR